MPGDLIRLTYDGEFHSVAAVVTYGDASGSPAIRITMDHKVKIDTMAAMRTEDGFALRVNSDA